MMSRMLATLVTSLTLLLAGSALAQQDDRPDKHDRQNKPDAPRDEQRDDADKQRNDGDRDGRRDDGERRDNDDRRDRGDRNDDDDDRDGRRGGWRWGPRPAKPLQEWLSDEEIDLVIAAVEAKHAELGEKLEQGVKHHRYPPPKPLTDEQLAQALEIFEDRDPHIAGRIREGVEKDADRIKRMLAYQWPWLEQAIEQKKTDPQRYALENKAIRHGFALRGLSWMYRRAKGENDETKAAEIKQKMRETYIAHEQARRELREHELKELEEKISDLKDRIQTDKEIKATADERVDDMLNRRFRRPGSRGDGDRDGRERGDGDRGDGDRGGRNDRERSDRKD